MPKENITQTRIINIREETLKTMNNLEKEQELIMDMKGGESNCCGAGTYGELMICEKCGEHCDNELK